MEFCFDYPGKSSISYNTSGNDYNFYDVRTVPYGEDEKLIDWGNGNTTTVIRDPNSLLDADSITTIGCSSSRGDEFNIFSSEDKSIILSDPDTGKSILTYSQGFFCF